MLNSDAIDKFFKEISKVLESVLYEMLFTREYNFRHHVWLDGRWTGFWNIVD